jgi:phosphate transport system substrate-binding protein
LSKEAGIVMTETAPGRPGRKTSLVGIGAAIALLLAACGPASSASYSQHASTASVGSHGAGLPLTGAGSTFDAPFFDVAFAAYEHKHAGVAIDYSAVGSSAGIKAFKNNAVNFGASDVPLSSAERAGAKGGALVQVPVDLGAEVVVYNIGSPTFVQLDLTGSLIARIFLGQIKRWNDPAIRMLNPTVDLPDERITVVHRSDGSGTTYIFSNYLASVDATWASRVGVGKSLHWPVGIGAEGSSGVAQSVHYTPGAIGYIERSYTAGGAFDYAAIRNRAGRYTIPSTESITAAAAKKPDISPASFSIVDEPGSNSYPICGYSWALVYVRQADKQTGKALVDLMDWLTHAGQADAAATSYVPLPSRIKALASTTLERVVGPSGSRLLG